MLERSIVLLPDNKDLECVPKPTKEMRHNADLYYVNIVKGWNEIAKKKTGLKELPDIAWEKIEKFLPHYSKSPKGGRPRAELRKIMNGILYVLRTGCQWKMVPKEYGSGSMCYRYFQEWEKAGVIKNSGKLSFMNMMKKRDNLDMASD